MHIQVNGKQRTLSPEQTIADLLQQLEVEPERVVVERNREIVARDRFAATTLDEGDTLEILHFVGGG
jgi:thiamine biosynthesis protein ThiS